MAQGHRPQMAPKGSARPKLGPMLAIPVAVIVVGVGVFAYLTRTPSEAPVRPRPVATASTPAAAPAIPCPGRPETVSLIGAEPTAINPNNCQVRVVVANGGCALFFAADNRRLARTCTGGSYLQEADVVATAKSENGSEVQVVVNNCPPGSTGNNTNRCN